MAPAKRARPSFSPPRPGKSKTVPKSNIDKSSSLNPSKSRRRNASTTRVAKANSKKNKRPAVIALVDAEASADDDEDDDEDMESGNGSHDEDQSQDETDTSHAHQAESSPEPSVILAEVTREDDSNMDQHIIPVPLLHRILHHNFQDAEKTKMSTDARELVSKYIETFVREAIARSSFENEERNKSAGGWLEVDDLERTAVQLCLDF